MAILQMDYRSHAYSLAMRERHKNAALHDPWNFLLLWRDTSIIFPAMPGPACLSGCPGTSAPDHWDGVDARFYAQQRRTDGAWRGVV